ncbi:hypothetical protein [Pseudomonas sp. LRF_L74]
MSQPAIAIPPSVELDLALVAGRIGAEVPMAIDGQRSRTLKKS